MGSAEPVKPSFSKAGQWGQTWQKSVANYFSNERIRIWILFAKDIFYEYKYEYYSWHLVSQIWIRVLFVTNIHEYIWIFKSQVISTYPSKDCGKDIQTLF